MTNGSHPHGKKIAAKSTGNGGKSGRKGAAKSAGK
ncbi:hypothetical protein Pan44_07880 [Caulifigura coniformis]|uniref:Uncharacterized protein n=1 Tax=Caulifigura coniformis TaxID=2527983 RepID=A0A517S9K3_9PLAN|nr:hypothetical protein Pan44_07880 [Caulifigura coniformis]